MLGPGLQGEVRDLDPNFYLPTRTGAGGGVFLG